ncbi:hypothetical protein ACIQC5_10950 [Paenarthrobacter sp. NPDC092416]|uniref:hypothetical protein n=1 Tax=Paenarthrobacter sp. NPDC092416 TaxID=3364386 RepID=UPI0037FDBEF0
MIRTSDKFHAALSLAHRWFAFLETPAGNVEEHLGLFAKDVQLTGRRGQVCFAHGRAELERWFGAVPEEISSHRIIHSTWTDGEGEVGKLDFVVAYQATTAHGGVSGSIISYETVISFANDQPHFLALDKTPILPNARKEYAPTWAEHRVLGFVHAALSGQLTSQAATDALHLALSAGSNVGVWAPAPELSRVYDAFLTVGTSEGNVYTAWWRFHDDGDAAFPALERTAPLRRQTTQDDETNSDMRSRS